MALVVQAATVLLALLVVYGAGYWRGWKACERWCATVVYENEKHRD